MSEGQFTQYKQKDQQKDAIPIYYFQDSFNQDGQIEQDTPDYIQIGNPTGTTRQHGVDPQPHKNQLCQLYWLAESHSSQQSQFEQESPQLAFQSLSSAERPSNQQSEVEKQAKNKNMPAFFGRIIYNKLDKKIQKKIKKPTTLAGISSLVQKSEKFQRQGKELLSSFEIIDLILSSHHQKDVESPLGLIKQMYKAFKNKTEITSFADQ